VVGTLGPQATYLLPGALLLLATAVSLRLAPAPTDSTDVTDPTELVPAAVTL